MSVLLKFIYNTGGMSTNSRIRLIPWNNVYALVNKMYINLEEVGILK